MTNRVANSIGDTHMSIAPIQYMYVIGLLPLSFKFFFFLVTTNQIIILPSTSYKELP